MTEGNRYTYRPTEKKRHIFRCEVCHNVVRKAKPAQYCSDACKQVAYRQRKLIALEQERQQRAEALRQMRLEAEALRRQRAEAERLRQTEAERQRQQVEQQRAIESEQQRKAEAKARQAQQLAAAVPVCKCGKRHWMIECKQTMLGMKHSMTCLECGTKIKPTVDPGNICCRSAVRFYDYRYEIDAQGTLTCRFLAGCGDVKQWGNWPLHQH